MPTKNQKLQRTLESALELPLLYLFKVEAYELRRVTVGVNMPLGI